MPRFHVGDSVRVIVNTQPAPGALRGRADVTVTPDGHIEVRGIVNLRLPDDRPRVAHAMTRVREVSTSAYRKPTAEGVLGIDHSGDDPAVQPSIGVKATPSRSASTACMLPRTDHRQRGAHGM